MLTVEEKADLASGFKAAGERMSDVEDDMQQIKHNFDDLHKFLKVYTKNLVHASLGAGSPQGFWPNEGDARAFGEIILQALGRKEKAMGEGTNVGGGILIPDELSSTIIQKLGKYGKYRANATVVLLGRDRQLVPKVDSDLTIYCPGEGAEITESDMKFSQIGLTAKAWCALAAISNELAEDSVIGIGEIIAISMTRSMAKKEDLVGFMGDGTSTYFGMTGITGALRGVDETIGNIKGLEVASGNAYSEITLGDFRKVIGILPEDCDDTAKWYMSKKFYFNVVYPLAETAGVANIFEILSDRKGRFLLGYEVQFVSCMPSSEADSQICALLGDLQMGAYLGERKVLSIEQNPGPFFIKNQLAIRGVERIDINAFGVGDTTEPGPIVGLITAAT